jgi:hypothetical protein
LCSYYAKFKENLVFGEDAQNGANLEPPLVRGQSVDKVGDWDQLRHRGEDDVTALKEIYTCFEF